jgi:four helix bundle protein
MDLIFANPYLPDKTVMKNFKELRTWQKGFDIAVGTYKLVESFPKEERFALSGQMTKAAVSIPSNIAEGSSRSSDRDYKRFLEISLGSCFELETQLLIAEAVNFGDAIKRTELIFTIWDEEKMLWGFISKLSE